MMEERRVEIVVQNMQKRMIEASGYLSVGRREGDDEGLFPRFFYYYYF